MLGEQLFRSAVATIGRQRSLRVKSGGALGSPPLSQILRFTYHAGIG